MIPLAIVAPVTEGADMTIGEGKAIYSPCSNEGHQGEGDGEDNPEHCVSVARKTSIELKQSSPGVSVVELFKLFVDPSRSQPHSHTAELEPEEKT